MWEILKTVCHFLLPKNGCAKTGKHHLLKYNSIHSGGDLVGQPSKVTKYEICVCFNFPPEQLRKKTVQGDLTLTPGNTWFHWVRLLNTYISLENTFKHKERPIWAGGMIKRSSFNVHMGMWVMSWERLLKTWTYSLSDSSGDVRVL